MRLIRLPDRLFSRKSVTGALASVTILFASHGGAEPVLESLPAPPEAPSDLVTPSDGESGDSGAPADPQALSREIASMVKAMEQGTYGGRFVHIRGDQLDLMRVVHRRVDGRRVELMVSENGEIREIRRVGDRCACVWPERDQVMLGDYPNINGR
ncbi:MAG TPA: hypothetical protein ENO14_00090, partial [Chromatiales bacterium]|nr:hypothetical protein [Chromatiales bacterium]